MYFFIRDFSSLQRFSSSQKQSIYLSLAIVLIDLYLNFCCGVKIPHTLMDFLFQRHWFSFSLPLLSNFHSYTNVGNRISSILNKCPNHFNCLIISVIVSSTIMIILISVILFFIIVTSLQTCYVYHFICVRWLKRIKTQNLFWGLTVLLQTRGREPRSVLVNSSSQ